MEIILKKLSEITPADYNPRQICKEQLARLKASIEKFDLVEPLVWNRRTDNLVGGHQRLSALESLGRTEAQVVVVDLSLSEEKALNLALNRISGEWDLDKLKEVILEIDGEDGLPIELTGFDYDELEDLIGYGEDDDGLEGDLDKLPSKPEKPVTKLGDIWLLGEHRLMCGDSLDREHLDLLLNEQKADMVFTDPPYNVDYQDTFGRKILNDKREDFSDFLQQIYSNLLYACDDNAPAYVCYAESHVMDFMGMAIQAKWSYRNTLIWLKDLQAMNFGHYTWKYEPILYLAKGSPAFYGQKNHSNVIEVPSFNSFAGRKDDHGNTVNRSLHPNQKPVDLILKLIHNSSQKGEVVLDLFGGSGSTLIACEKSGRKAHLMELDPGYCDVIVERWEKLTGQKGKKIHG